MVEGKDGLKPTNLSGEIFPDKPPILTPNKQPDQVGLTEKRKPYIFPPLEKAAQAVDRRKEFARLREEIRLREEREKLEFESHVQKPGEGEGRPKQPPVIPVTTDKSPTEVDLSEEKFPTLPVKNPDKKIIRDSTKQKRDVSRNIPPFQKGDRGHEGESILAARERYERNLARLRYNLEIEDTLEALKKTEMQAEALRARERRVKQSDKSK